MIEPGKAPMKPAGTQPVGQNPNINNKQFGGPVAPSVAVKGALMRLRIMRRMKTK
jgi:hypothetical protein